MRLQELRAFVSQQMESTMQHHHKLIGKEAAAGRSRCVIL